MSALSTRSEICACQRGGWRTKRKESWYIFRASHFFHFPFLAIDFWSLHVVVRPPPPGPLLLSLPLDPSIGATFSAVSIHSSVPLSTVGLQGAGHPGTPADGQQDGSWIWICCWSFLGNEAAELRAASVRCRFHFIRTRLVDLAWQRSSCVKRFW